MQVTRCAAAVIVHEIGYERYSRVIFVGSRGHTVNIQIILNRHEPIREMIIGVRDLPMPLANPQSTSMMPQRK